MVGCQNPSSELDYNVDSVLVGIAEAFDGEWQDTGTQICTVWAILQGIARM